METEHPVMQRENERRRLTVEGRRTDDGARCTVLLVHERQGGCWSFYPHGADQLGVRLEHALAQEMARAMLDGAECAPPGSADHDRGCK